MTWVVGDSKRTTAARMLRNVGSKARSSYTRKSEFPATQSEVSGLQTLKVGRTSPTDTNLTEAPFTRDVGAGNDVTRALTVNFQHGVQKFRLPSTTGTRRGSIGVDAAAAGPRCASRITEAVCINNPWI